MQWFNPHVQSFKKSGVSISTTELSVASLLGTASWIWCKNEKEREFQNQTAEMGKVVLSREVKVTDF